MSLDRIISDDGKQLTIVLDEKFDFGKVQDFRTAYESNSEGLTRIVIDLSQTEYMDSSALGMLLNMHKIMSARISEFSIVNCRPQVLKILQISRFDKKFVIA
jgi:anti-anti-sigma factor